MRPKGFCEQLAWFVSGKSHQDWLASSSVSNSQQRMQNPLWPGEELFRGPYLQSHNKYNWLSFEQNIVSLLLWSDYSRGSLTRYFFALSIMYLDPFFKAEKPFLLLSQPQPRQKCTSWHTQSNLDLICWIRCNCGEQHQVLVRTHYQCIAYQETAFARQNFGRD